MDPLVKFALDRLVAVATRDSGQSRIIANFLLAWWNADEQGGFDLVELWSLDDSLVADCKTIIDFIASHRAYPDTLGYETQFKTIIALWRSSKRKRRS